MDSEPTQTKKKLKRHRLYSIILILTGMALVLLVGYIEDDPIVPPFLIIFGGVGWFVTTLVRIQRLRTK